MQVRPFHDFIFCLKLVNVPESLISSGKDSGKLTNFIYNQKACTNAAREYSLFVQPIVKVYYLDVCKSG